MFLSPYLYGKLSRVLCIFPARTQQPCATVSSATCLEPQRHHGTLGPGRGALAPLDSITYVTWARGTVTAEGADRYTRSLIFLQPPERQFQILPRPQNFVRYNAPSCCCTIFIRHCSPDAATPSWLSCSIE